MTAPTLFGPEFQVNTIAAQGQFSPAIAALATVGFVVGWTDDSQSSSDTSDSGVRGQVFAAGGGPVGPEFQANTVITGFQYSAAVSGFAGGGFVMAWVDESQSAGDLSGRAVRAQIYGADGVASGAEFVVNATTTGAQVDPALTTLADGRFVASWVDFSQTAGDTSASAIRAQVFNADGSRAGATILVNTTVAGIQFEPKVTELADGRVVVTWTDHSATGDDTSGWAVRAQILDPRTAAVVLAGSRVADDLFGTRFDDSIAGAQGNDSLDGAAGDDLLTGAAGADRLAGAADNDTLTGGSGLDRVKRGGGLDEFVFATGSARDIVTDFTGGQDRIDLSAYGFATLGAAKSHFADAGADCVFTLGGDLLVFNGWSVAQIGVGDLIL